jgi:hypothetical protein
MDLISGRRAGASDSGRTEIRRQPACAAFPWRNDILVVAACEHPQRAALNIHAIASRANAPPVKPVNEMAGGGGSEVYSRVRPGESTESPTLSLDTNR